MQIASMILDIPKLAYSLKHYMAHRLRAQSDNQNEAVKDSNYNWPQAENPSDEVSRGRSGVLWQEGHGFTGGNGSAMGNSHKYCWRNSWRTLVRWTRQRISCLCNDKGSEAETSRGYRNSISKSLHLRNTKSNCNNDSRKTWGSHRHARQLNNRDRQN